jgi:hypothetical protein
VLPLSEQVVDVGVEAAAMVDIDGLIRSRGLEDLTCVRVNHLVYEHAALPETDGLAAEPADALLGPHAREARSARPTSLVYWVKH